MDAAIRDTGSGGGARMTGHPVQQGLGVRIAGIGSFLPSRVVTNAELEDQLGIERDWIFDRTGVRERRRCTTESSASMAAAAARDALVMAGLEPRDLTAIIGASSTPQQAIPCTAVFVQRALAAPEGTAACFDLNATCLSFIAAFDVAARLVASGAHRHVLVFSSESAAHSLDPREPESAVLFGDAAAAVVLSPAHDTGSVMHAMRLRTWNSGAEYSQIAGGGTLHHPNAPGTTSAHNLFMMQGPKLFRMAAPLLQPFIDEVLGDAGWSRADVDAVVPHQASRHGIELAWKRLGFSESQVIVNIATRGNCIAASIPLALAEAVACSRIRRGDRALLFGLAAGLSLGAIAITF
ncbi:MAG TPA: ketoacyl-ACP synthase III [Gemmatimonadaceae bacterium]|nr:ketoacyl-ACP synthase III [Gemmatimonadaceae bacterium]